MSASQIETLMYEMVTDMTVANGFNFEWFIQGDKDIRKGDRTVSNGAITIGFQSENNTNQNGGIGSGQYIDDAIVMVTGKVNMAGTNVRGYDVEVETKKAYTKALDDIKTRYDSPKYLCQNELDCRGLMYQSGEIVKISEEGKFRSMRVECLFLVKYVTQRKLLDA
jgi:hypothetical protein